MRVGNVVIEIFNIFKIGFYGDSNSNESFDNHQDVQMEEFVLRKDRSCDVRML